MISQQAQTPATENNEPMGESASLSELPNEAFLIGTYETSRDKDLENEHLLELEQLVISYGGTIIDKMLCPLKKAVPATFLGSGKIEEVAALVKEKGAKLVVFDTELSPSQQRNLEQQLGVAVADRSEIILGVFARHARSKEARLQVELAQIQHHMPRLKRLWTHLSRQRGGGVNQKGEGETQIEIDRRILKKRLELLKGQIEDLQQVRDVKYQARERSQICSFAIVGYTNAGKSTLMNAMTNAGVLVEDKLFATLDTTTRKYKLPSGTESLLIDTVGFIRKLPHLLIAAFRSTLQEAAQADFLVHLVDGSHPSVHDHIRATEEVLKELGCMDVERLIVFNKSDQMSSEQILEMRLRYVGACFVSALTAQGLDELAQKMDYAISQRFSPVVLRIPQDKFELVNQIYQMGKVIEIDYCENDIILRAQLNDRDKGRFATYLIDGLGYT